MTLIARRFIKIAIGFLAIGLLLGGWILIRGEMYGEWPVAGRQHGIIGTSVVVTLTTLIIYCVSLLLSR